MTRNGTFKAHRLAIAVAFVEVVGLQTHFRKPPHADQHERVRHEPAVRSPYIVMFAKRPSVGVWVGIELTRVSRESDEFIILESE